MTEEEKRDYNRTYQHSEQGRSAHNLAARKWSASNREQENKRKRKYYQTHPEARARKRAYYLMRKKES